MIQQQEKDRRKEVHFLLFLNSLPWWQKSNLFFTKSRLYNAAISTRITQLWSFLTKAYLASVSGPQHATILSGRKIGKGISHSCDLSDHLEERLELR